MNTANIFKLLLGGVFIAFFSLGIFIIFQNQTAQPNNTNENLPVINDSTQNDQEPEQPTHDLIRVTTPQANMTVISPLRIEGEARGTWYFEASFPIRIIDADGKELGVAVAQAQEDWMTEDFVPFIATLTFSTPTTETGTLILQKDNPSGLPEYDDELRIPVTFSQLQP